MDGTTEKISQKTTRTILFDWIHEYTLSDVPFNVVWYVASGLEAGPLVTAPLVAKSEP
jgi:hypothetical protein